MAANKEGFIHAAERNTLSDQPTYAFFPPPRNILARKKKVCFKERKNQSGTELTQTDPISTTLFFLKDPMHEDPASRRGEKGEGWGKGTFAVKAIAQGALAGSLPKCYLSCFCPFEGGPSSSLQLWRPNLQATEKVPSSLRTARLASSSKPSSMD